MGWWSTDIMGGDTPLDYKDAFYDICGVDEFPETGVRINLTREDIETHLNEMVEFLDKNKWGDSDIGYQVLGVLLLRAGATINGDLRDFIMQACENDEWAAEDDRRLAATTNLFNAIRDYENGIPVRITSKGLFEVMFDKLSNDSSKS